MYSLTSTKIARTLSLLWFACQATHAQRVVVLEEGLNGYSGFEDATLFSETDSSAGGGAGVVSGTIKNNPWHRRALVRADLFFIPPGAMVVDASLSMVVVNSGGNFGDFDYRLHRVSKPWGEGTNVPDNAGGQGIPADVGDATWRSNFHDQTEWTVPGGDFAPAPSAVAPAGRTGAVGVWSGANMADDIEAWIDSPSTNFGWILISTIEGTFQRVKLFSSSEATSNRPRLTLTVDLDPGDVDLDGKLSARDVQLVVNALLGNGTNRFLADVNGDGFVTKADLDRVSDRATRRAK